MRRGMKLGMVRMVGSEALGWVLTELMKSFWGCFVLCDLAIGFYTKRFG